MSGSVSTPIKAVNSSSTAVSLCLKYCSTKYLSKCVEIAHSTGPENAKTSQDISFAALGGGQAQGGTLSLPMRSRIVDRARGRAPSHAGYPSADVPGRPDISVQDGRQPRVGTISPFFPIK
jgi:hypothetical protein